MVRSLTRTSRVIGVSPHFLHKRAVAALGPIRRLIGINLSIGLVTIAVVFLGRVLGWVYKVGL